MYLASESDLESRFSPILMLIVVVVFFFVVAGKAEDLTAGMPGSGAGSAGRSPWGGGEPLLDSIQIGVDLMLLSKLETLLLWNS